MQVLRERCNTSSHPMGFCQHNKGQYHTEDVFDKKKEYYGNIKRMIHKMAMGNTGYPLRKFSRSFPGRGGHWGVPNTTIPYEKLTNTEIPCRKWTKYRYRIYDRWRLLNVVSISRVFFVKHVYTRNQPQPSWENVRRSWIDLYNDWKARSLDVLSISS